jgi:hypothetical protein
MSLQTFSGNRKLPEGTDRHAGITGACEKEFKGEYGIGEKGS